MGKLGERKGPKSIAPRRDDLPMISATVLQREDRLTRDTTNVEVMLDNQFFTVRVVATQLWYKGYWNHFICPTCSRMVRILRLLGERLVCKRCDGLLYRSQLDNKPGKRGHSAAMKDSAIDRWTESLKFSVRSKRAILRRIRKAAIIQREYRLEGNRAHFSARKRKRLASGPKTEP